MKKALLISVGGSPTPVIYSINAQKPEYLFFFVSRSSAASAREQILPALTHKPSVYEFIMTSDEQDIEKSVAVLLAEVPAKLEMWGLTFADLVADYTGGTKTMSAAVVLSLSRDIDSFSYVGGTERDKSGLGVVIDGREQILNLKNPWNELAIQSLNDIQILFNSCRYTSAAEMAETARDKTPARRQLFEGLRLLATALNLWDNFQYDRAFSELKRCDSLLRTLAAETDKQPIKLLCKDVAVCLPLLEKICHEQNILVKSSPGNPKNEAADGMSIIRDLTANAIRRGEIEHKYDDAVARLYSAIEKMAKMRLKSAYAIDNSDIKPEQIPESIRDEIVAECTNEREGKIQIPLHKSYHLLEKLADPLGIAYAAAANELGKVLTIRNMSLLAHGYEPVKQETYSKMLSIALGFIGDKRCDVSSFPKLSFENRTL
ncbi:MAG: TIGR02710 family CRISPR-associated CARF protein [Desulfuromonadaceae bacterium]|nr:TIGR02710 family CRISPR-associated CARF protein [Desulfuromonadaceae bacterium]MDD2855885.1 TIGR02710 family CRISPR-associated CARF protein [Desulfuromonadaceae bacterium]